MENESHFADDWHLFVERLGGCSLRAMKGSVCLTGMIKRHINHTASSPYLTVK
jgi:hypothetical protein